MVESGILGAVIYEIARQTVGDGINDHAKTTAVLRQWLHDHDELARYWPLISIHYHRAMRQDRQSRLIKRFEWTISARSASEYPVPDRAASTRMPERRRLRLRG